MDMKAPLALLLLLLAAGPVLAEEAKPAPSGLMSWFKHLKEGLRESSVSGRFQKGHRPSAVAAVRGELNADDRSDPNQTSMSKSNKDKKAKKALKKERAAFEASVDLIVAGKFPEAVASLEDFQKKYPQSEYLADVQEAKAKALELQAAAPAGESAAAPAAAASEAPAPAAASEATKPQ